MRVRVYCAEIPEEPGVYVVYERLQEDRPLYVGVAAKQTLRKRWEQHLDLRSGRSALRRSLAVHLGLVGEKLRKVDGQYSPEVEQQLTRALEFLWVEFHPASDAAEARELEAELIRSLDPRLNVVRPSAPAVDPAPPAPLPSGKSPRGSRTALSEVGDLSHLVADYLERCWPRERSDLEHYAGLSHDEAVREASQALDASGARHPHQRRLKAEALAAVHERLKGTELASCRQFHDLFTTLENTIGKIRGVGPLMVYDTAIRLGANLGLEPEQVYLHRGAQAGAIDLGIGRKRTVAEVHEFPPELGGLTPLQIENFLCIYKGCFRVQAA